MSRRGVRLQVGLAGLGRGLGTGADGGRWAVVILRQHRKGICLTAGVRIESQLVYRLRLQLHLNIAV